MQSNYRADIGRNQMWSDFPTIRGLGVSSDGSLEEGGTFTLKYTSDDTLHNETVQTLQPASDGTNGQNSSGSGYIGNNTIRAYNFIIEDTLNKLNNESDDSNDKLAVNLKTIKDLKDELNDKIDDIISGGSGDFLKKDEAAATYETITSHNTDKQTLESSISLKANSADVYTKTQVDDLISDIGHGITEEELEEALEPYATKDWVEAAISASGGNSKGVVVESEINETTINDITLDHTNPSDKTTVLIGPYDGYEPQKYQDGYYSTWFVDIPDFEIKYKDSGTAWSLETDFFKFYVEQTSYVDDGQGKEPLPPVNLGILTLFPLDNGKYHLKGIFETRNDKGYFDLDFVVKWDLDKVEEAQIRSLYEDVKFDFADGDKVKCLRLIKQISSDGGYITRSEANNTYLTQASASTTYATKTYVDDAISDIPDEGLLSFDNIIDANTLTVNIEDGGTSAHTSDPIIELATAESSSTITFDINCTLTSNGTDITHDLDDYTFEIKDQTGHLCCALNSIYETEDNSDYTKLKGEYSGTITDSNNRLSLYITRTSSTPAETIVLTATETNIGTVNQTIGGYITKAYADSHYASKYKPTVINVDYDDYSTHTTKKTTYDFGPDFNIDINGELAFKVTVKVGGSPVTQMATAAITTALQFGLEQISGNDETYTMDIYNAIGTEQVNALSNFSNWIQNYSRYSDVEDISLDNFVITAALAEQRYLTSSSMSNYLTKTEASSTYLTQSNAANTYATLATLQNDYLSKASNLSTIFWDANDVLNITNTGTILINPKADGGITARMINISNSLIFGVNTTKSLTDVALSTDSKNTSDLTIATPGYINQYYYDKTETDSAISTAISNIPTPTIDKLQWTSGNYTYKLEPENSTGNVITMLNFKQENQTLARIASVTGLNASSNIFTDKLTPTTAIVFGKNIDDTNQLNNWSSTLVNVANDNYDSTTYSSVNKDTIVPSLKFLENQHYTKTQVDSAITAGIGALSNTYLGINATAKNAEKLQWETSDNHTSTLYEDTNGNLGLKWDNDSKIVLVPRNGNILSCNLYPNAIVFGNTSVGQKSGKWEGTISNIVNNANKTTADSAADSTKDTYVPSYRVLQDNYYDKTTSDGRYLAASPNNNQRVTWTTSGDNSVLRFQKRADAQSEWTNTISMSIGTTTSSILAVEKICVGQSSFSGDFVSAIATSSSSASLSDTSVATPGYINQYYYDKTTIDSMIGGSSATPCCYAFNSWNVQNNKFTANTNFTDDICSFTMVNGSIIGYGGRVGFKIRIVFYLTDSTQKASALNSLKFRLESRVANHYNDIRVYGEPDEVYDESSSNYYDDRICVNFIGVWIDLTTSSSPSPLMGVRYKNTLSSDINLSASPMDITVRVWKL